jgi:hypothetical protein
MNQQKNVTNAQGICHVSPRLKIFGKCACSVYERLEHSDVTHYLVESGKKATGEKPKRAIKNEKQRIITLPYVIAVYSFQCRSLI